ncbi:MAG: hypothetical protein AAF086_05215 [Planctomycetota bacterium]
MVVFLLKFSFWPPGDWRFAWRLADVLGVTEANSPDYILDIPGLSPQADPHAPANGQSLRGRPWLSIKWKCCQTYSRIYRNRKGDAYEGRCPRCGSPVKATIGEGGVNARFFEAG